MFDTSNSSMRQLFLLLLLVATILSAQAQITIPVDLKQSTITTMPTGPYGFVVFDSLLYQKGDEDFFLKYSQYDTTFVKKWEQFIYFEERDRIVTHYNAGSHIYLLFQTSGDHIRLSRMDAKYGSVDTATFILPEKFETRSLHGLREHVWLEGTLGGSPTILKLNLFTRLTEAVPLNVNQAKAEVVSAQLFDGEFQFVVLDKVQKINRLVVHRLFNNEHEVEPINILSKSELSRIELVDNQYIVGQYGKDKAKPDGLFIVNIETKSYSEIGIKDIWGEPKAIVLRAKGQDEKTLARNNNTFLFEEISITADSVVIWLEVYQQKFRSKNITEKEIERQYRDFENFMAPGSFFGGTAGYTGSGTQRIEMRSREAQLNNAMATGFEYVCHLRLSLDKDGKIKSSQKYTTEEVDHLATLNNQNVHSIADGELILAYNNQALRLFSISGKSKKLYPEDETISRLGQTKITSWYGNTYLLRSYFKKGGEDYYTLQALKLQ